MLDTRLVVGYYKLSIMYCYSKNIENDDKSLDP